MQPNSTTQLRFNAFPVEVFHAAIGSGASDKEPSKKKELDSWENEGGEVPSVTPPQRDAGEARQPTFNDAA